MKAGEALCRHEQANFGALGSKSRGLAAASKWPKKCKTYSTFCGLWRSIFNIDNPGPKMQLAEIGTLIHARRRALGLSQEQLARMAGLSRATVNQLERGVLKDLGAAKLIALTGLVGITLSASSGNPRGNGLRMASVTAGVSHRRELPPQVLARALRSGLIPAGYEAQVASLIDEAPLEILVKAVEESARGAALPAKKIWAHLYRWARDFKSPRPAWGV